MNVISSSICDKGKPLQCQNLAYQKRCFLPGKGGEVLFLCGKHCRMEDLKPFQQTLNTARVICEFIAGEHYSVFRRIKGMSFGISSSIVSVRLFEPAPDMSQLDERTDALYKTLTGYGVKRLTAMAFSGGTKITFDYDDKGKKSMSGEPDVALDGWFFRTDTGGRKNFILHTPSALFDIVGPIISPLLEASGYSGVFLNGEECSFTKT